MTFEYVKLNMWNTGEEVATAYATFDIDNRGIWVGRKYVLTNNHVKNSWEIHLWSENSYIKFIERGKEETLSLGEFKEWLSDRNVPDAYMEYLINHPEYVESNPGMLGAEFVTGGKKNEK